METTPSKKLRSKEGSLGKRTCWKRQQRGELSWNLIPSIEVQRKRETKDLHKESSETGVLKSLQKKKEIRH